jgi:hypothetical protein
MANDVTLPTGHTAFKVEANIDGVPMTGPLGLVESSDGQIIGRLVIIWPMGVAREQAEIALRDMYATAMLEIDKREDESRRARLA